MVFACDCLDAYVFGRDLVIVETDHKLLEPIFTKPLAATPQCLQRMLLHLQKYNLQQYNLHTELHLPARGECHRVFKRVGRHRPPCLAPGIK